MRKKWFTMANLLYRSGRLAALLGKNLIKPRIKKFLQEHQTDILISVVPVFNRIFLEVAQELHITFFLVPTDLDATTFVAGIKKSQYPRFFITQAFDDNDIKQTIVKSGICHSNLNITSFPIRSDFFEEKNKADIKKQYNVAENKPVIMILMGAVGSQESYHYMKHLLEVSKPCHIIICVGKNEELKTKINELELPYHITMTLVGFTDRISDIMAITDLFITKSGTVSVCEGIYMNLPTLLDHTTRSMLWENLNLHFIKKNGFGDIINYYKDIKPLVEKYLSNPELLLSTKRRLASYDKKHFGTSFKQLLREVCT
jgi:processive 1,2-diacylglycerol beta-glucosyltransferase